MLSKNWFALVSATVAGTAGLGLFAGHVSAQTDLSACGQDMYIGVEAECEVVPPAECTAKCTPLSVQAACAAELSVQCDGGCNLQAEASCTGSCSANCEADCMATPGEFSCEAECRGSCDVDCGAKCNAMAGNGEAKARCEASCKASCSGDCTASCKATPPSASCKAKCDASCQGSCKARVNADCQINCQSKGYIDCQARVEGGCKVSCMQNPDGGLFCDGQFVKSSSIDQCAAAIEALLDVDVDGYASADGSCENGTCSGEAEAGVTFGGGDGGCSTMPGKAKGMAGLFSFLSVGLVLALGRRRRRS